MSQAKIANYTLGGGELEFDLAAGVRTQSNSTEQAQNTSVTDPLQSLLERKDLWRAGAWQGEYPSQQSGYPSGFSELDRHLADNGWPQQGVCEFLCHGAGQGELSIILPLLKRFLCTTQIKSLDNSEFSDPIVLLVAPPFIPYPQALELQGIDVQRLVWLDSHDRKEQLWAIEQALSSGTVPLVLAWLDNLSITESRRLQLAAEKGKSLCFLYLPLKVANDSHPVTLRLSLRRERYSVVKDQNLPLRIINTVGKTRVDIIKRRGGWPSTEFSLSLLPPHLKQSLLGVESFLANDLSHHSGNRSVNELDKHSQVEWDKAPVSDSANAVDACDKHKSNRQKITLSLVTNRSNLASNKLSTAMTQHQIDSH